MIDFDKYTENELRMGVAIIILIALGIAISLGAISNHQDQITYNNKVVECGGAENVEEHFSQVDQITYYTCSK